MRFLSLSRCAILFIIGWSLGCILLFIILSFHDDSNSSSYRIISLINQSQLPLLYHNLRHSNNNPATMMPQQLPDFTSIYAHTDDDSDHAFIFLDWPKTDALFSIHNYKALESLLSLFPTAKFRFAYPKTNLPQTNPSFSLYHFEKYTKLGYNFAMISFDIHSKMKISYIGEKYRRRWSEKCCSKHNLHNMMTNFTLANIENYRKDHVLPYHLLMYFRLLQLWHKGGIYSDLSFYFINPISEQHIRNGYYINSYCTHHENSKQKLSVYYPKSYDSWNSLECYTSTMLIFHEKRHKILTCVLNNYSNDIFLVCIESDPFYGGSECIRKAFEQCFLEFKTINDLQTESGVMETFDNDPIKAKETLLAPNWTVSVNTRVVWMGHLAWEGHWNPYPYPKHSLLNAAMEKTQALITNTTYLTNSLVFSNTKTCSSYSTSLTLSLLPKKKRPLTGITLHSNKSLSTISNLWLASQSKVPWICSPSIYFPGFISSFSNTFIHMIASHPYVLPGGSMNLEEEHSSSFSSGNNQILSRQQNSLDHDICLNLYARDLLDISTRTKCYPFVEPFDPFIILDTTIYSTIDLQIPLIIKQDNPLASILFYLQHPIERMYYEYMTYFLKLPYVQSVSFDDYILSVIVDPNSELSQLRQLITSSSSSTNVWEIIYRILNIQQLDQKKSSSSSSSTSSTSSTTTSSSSLQNTLHIHQLYLHSIYLPMIFYYESILSSGQIFLYTDIQLQSLFQSNNLLNNNQQLYQFLMQLYKQLHLPLDVRQELPQSEEQLTALFYEIKSTLYESSIFHSQHFQSLSSQYQISQDCYMKLITFFQPFNELLMNNTHLNVSTWFNLLPSNNTLPKYSPGYNQSRPLLWFESAISDNKATQMPLMGHLIPGRTSAEDNGFNTTLGMLNTF